MGRTKRTIYLSVKEAASCFGVRVEILREWLRDGKFPAVEILGMWRIRKDDVDLALSKGWPLNHGIEGIGERGTFSSKSLLEDILNRFITHIQTREGVILSTENDYGGGFSSPSDEEREEWCNSFIDSLQEEEEMSVTRRRLEDCARGEEVLGEELLGLTIKELRERWDIVSDGIRAAQSLDDLGEEENKRVWDSMCRQIKFLEEISKELERRLGKKRMFENYKTGDIVTRMLGGILPQELTVTEVTDDLIICGPWRFSKTNGLEIDEDLGWDETHSGSFLKKPEN